MAQYYPIKTRLKTATKSIPSCNIVKKPKIKIPSVKLIPAEIVSVSADPDYITVPAANADIGSIIIQEEDSQFSNNCNNVDIFKKNTTPVASYPQPLEIQGLDFIDFNNLETLNKSDALLENIKNNMRGSWKRKWQSALSKDVGDNAATSDDNINDKLTNCNLSDILRRDDICIDNIKNSKF